MTRKTNQSPRMHLRLQQRRKRRRMTTRNRKNLKLRSKAFEIMSSEQRSENYLCDITYVTNSELDFDYMRDNLAMSVDELVLRGFNYCVIDEVDSILIDEARTPLIISGSAERPSDRYYKADKIAMAFERDIHYTVRSSTE